MVLNYSKKLLDHFFHPRNMGKIKNPDGVGTAGNPMCGDVLRLYIKVKDNKITDIKFETLGCAAAIGVSSALTEMVKGKTIDEALKIKNEDIVKELGGIPPIKFHCSVLGAQALEAAIKDYQKKQK
ncbi:MAG: iron-sulfur cluster assembly scaffold protein [Patescibacteria group bacterium]